MPKTRHTGSHSTAPYLGAASGLAGTRRSALPHNLPYPSTSFVGRQKELVAFEHSWHLLLARDQEISARLTVFQGGFDEAAANDVAAASSAALARLEDNSMIYRRAERYHIHELLRQFGAGKLADVAAHAIRRRHCAYYASFLQQLESLMLTSREPAALQSINIELDNIGAGWRWAFTRLVDPDDTDTIIEVVRQYGPILAHFYERRSRFREGGRLFRQAAAAIQAADWPDAVASDLPASKRRLILALVQVWEARLYFNLGRYKEVEQLLMDSLSVLRQIIPMLWTALPG